MNPQQILAAVSRLTTPLSNRVQNIVRRATVSRVDDSKKMQEVQVTVLDGEDRNSVERPQAYGFTSVPEEGAEVVLVSVGGRGDHPLAIVVDDRRYRPRNLKSGESAQYNNAGCTILLKANGDIEITAAGNVILNGGSVDVAKVGSSVVAGPFGGTVTSGSSTVKVP